jgi:Uma2 family endonuclease
MTTQTRLLTYEEYLNEPESKERREIVDGEVVMVAAPTLYHQTISVNILGPTHYFVTMQGLGRIWHAPLDVVVEQEPVRVRQPDLLFVSNERSHILGDRMINGGPDLVMEILSPSNTRRYIESKLADYALIDVRECWLVSPEARTVEVLRLDGGEWRRAYIRGPGERIESAVLPGLDLDIAAIFQGV